MPEPGETADAEIDGAEARAATASLGDDGASVTVFAPVEGAGFFDSRPRVALLVAVFLAIALTGVAVIARTLQSQIAAMLGAARRIGSGDFSQRVPVVGRDEMAGLASEFNMMTDQLEQQIAQLRRQRVELDRSVRRLGEAFAAGLDRETLLRIVAETALGACNAEYARVSFSDGEVIEVPEFFAGPARDAAVAGQKRADREGVRGGRPPGRGLCTRRAAQDALGQRPGRLAVDRADGQGVRRRGSRRVLSICSARPRSRSRTSPRTRRSPSRR